MHSMESVERSVVRSALVMCPFVDLVNLIAPFDAIANWGCGLFSACAIENSFGPGEVGAIRSVSLAASDKACERLGGGPPPLTMRQRLTATNAEKCMLRHERKLHVEWCELPSPAGSPLPRPHEGCVTTLIAFPITEEVDRCVVELRTTFTARCASDAAALEKFMAEGLQRPLLQCLCEVALVTAYDVDPRRETEYFAEFKRFESDAMQLRVDPALDSRIPRMFDALFASWVTMARRERQLHGRLAGAEQELAAAQALLAGVQAQLVQVERDQLTTKVSDSNDTTDPAAAASEAVRARVRDSIRRLRPVPVDAPEARRLATEESPPPAPAVARGALIAGCFVSQSQLLELFSDLLDDAGAPRDSTTLPLPVVARFWSYMSARSGGEAIDVPPCDAVLRWAARHNIAGVEQTGLNFEQFSLLALHLSQR